MPSSVADWAALGQLLEDHRLRLLATLRRRLDPKLNPRLDAEEILSEAFLLARRRWAAFQAQSEMKPYPWLYRIALDCLIEAWRRETRGPRDCTAADAVAGANVAAARPGPGASRNQSERSLVRDELRQRVRLVMAQLKDSDREILLMRHFDELSYVDISAVLGIPRTPPSSADHRAAGQRSAIYGCNRIPTRAPCHERVHLRGPWRRRLAAPVPAGVRNRRGSGGPRGSMVRAASRVWPGGCGRGRRWRNAGRPGPETDDGAPAQLGEFQIVRRLGISMGEVFEAWQPSLKRRVAIKTIRRGRISPQARERFLREQQVLAGLHQTHIVPIHAAGEEAGLQYFVMPYIDGAALHHVVHMAAHLEQLGHGRHDAVAQRACPAAADSQQEAVGESRPRHGAAHRRPRRIGARFGRRLGRPRRRCRSSISAPWPR